MLLVKFSHPLLIRKRPVGIFLLAKVLLLRLHRTSFKILDVSETKIELVHLTRIPE